MWLLQARTHRRRADDLWLGTATALVAGLVNVCSVMIFFAFSSNVTGHVASFAEEIVKGHWHQVGVALAWMLAFALGAFVASLCVTWLAPRRSPLVHGVPLLLQALVLCAVAHYGERHYLETLRETEVLVGVLLFTMGLQNGAVSTVSNAVVRTTHLTGLFTDLAGELAMILQPRFRQDEALRFRLKLHGLILAGYVLGGLAGGLACDLIGFRALYIAAALLGAVLAHDLVALAGAIQRGERGRYTEVAEPRAKGATSRR